MKSKPRWSTPNDNVPAFQPDTPWLLGAELASKKENRWQPKRERNDGGVEAALVSILMQRKPCARFIAIDKTGASLEAIETRFGGSTFGESQEYRRKASASEAASAAAKTL